ncbi:MAG: leucine--tRNA ligase [Candidatus Dormibacteria bacterium]
MQAPIPAGASDAYDHAAVEAKWGARWEREGLHRTALDGAKRPFYNLVMFPYPSAEGLHVGHLVPYSGADIYGRWRRLKGDDVFEPMGFDAFGIHSENYALKIGEHPRAMTQRAVRNFRDNQMKRLGTMFDWSRQVNTSEPDYYRWTQWLFVQLFNAGLAVRREGAVDWCPSCLTVLAHEQIEDGFCERCGTAVETRVLTQWWFRITDYAQPLLDALDDLDWSESTKTMQRNWIGRSEGAQLRFELRGCEASGVEVFTTRPDTLQGATFVVIGANHPHLDSYVSPERRVAVEAWRQQLPAPDAEPDFRVGIEIGSRAVHPLGGHELPVFAAPYVLGDYGTGAIMGVPAHDTRDHAFARAHALPIVRVISGGHSEIETEAYSGEGVLLNSGDLDGLPSREAARRVVERLEARGQGRSHVQFKLRDWLISRQRYWGPPIPIIHCPEHGPVAVPEDQLPVVLPEVEDFRPLGTGTSPLATVEEWVNAPCPTCGQPGRRETDVSDTFVDSSWYYLRYPSSERTDVAWDAERTRRWLPVDMYIGGNEHAVRHLLYSRFVMRALHGLGLVPEPEPFRRFRAHGMIVEGGQKMSKSRGNVINVDEVISNYGADAARMFITFLGPYEVGGTFREEGIRGVTRFLERVWRATQGAADPDTDDDARERRRHRLISRVDADYSTLAFNTVTAFLMEFARELDSDVQAGRGRRVDAETLLQLLAPLAPHITDELWERLGHAGSIHNTRWPEHDPELARARRITAAVQVNGKLRDQLEAEAGLSADELGRRALALPRVVELLAGREPRRVIAVPDRVVNIVV